MTAASDSNDQIDWRATAIWKQLVNREDNCSIEVRNVLSSRGCMPKIQTILRKAGTPLSDFTLHDADHSFRVAERMVEIIPSKVLPKLSTYELAFLLLTAYLHDIGMTPEYKKVDRHYSYLVTGKPLDLDKEEVEQFQLYLDDQADGVVPPLCRGKPSPEDLQTASRLVTCYCRHRHNDWSADWIESNLANMELADYKGWIPDLIRLCQSHHMGYEGLVGKSFDPQPVGSPLQIVHLRYLAAALRVADVLDIDPERTPEVILRHRDVHAGSVVYWWKDHYTTITIRDNCVIVFGRPDRAFIHRAIESTADEIESELKLVRKLDLDTHFAVGSWPGAVLPHEWGLFDSLHKDIKPRPNTYEYIDGAFRPDTGKLLQLLSGTELYGSPLPAIRELLQNAFDAVREEIAYKRLQRKDPADPDLETMLGELHSVELSIEEREDGAWLSCDDDGIGMTKSIIRDYLLVSGNSKRRDVLALERRCKESGFLLGRTGRFGIGVLSYFMLSDRIVIETKRSDADNGLDHTAWLFQTEGAGSFGELKQTIRKRPGTTVHLHLRKEVVGESLPTWCAQVERYLKNVLSYLPCRFEFRPKLAQDPSIVAKAGWMRPAKQFEHALLDGMFMNLRPDRDDNMPADLLPVRRQMELDEIQRERDAIIAEARVRLRWFVEEGELPYALGRYRVHVPYFQLTGGSSLAFLLIQGPSFDSALARIGQGYSFIPRGQSLTSWRGIRANHGRSRSSFLTDEPRLPSYVVSEVDWRHEDAGGIDVSRDSFAVSQPGIEATEWLASRIRNVVQQFVHANPESDYALLNTRVLGLASYGVRTLKWINKEDDASSWRPIEFPAINSLCYIYTRLPGKKLIWNNQKVSLVTCLGGPTDDDHYDGLGWNSINTPPDRIVAVPNYRLTIGPMWNERPTPPARILPIGLGSAFPPKWHTLCCVDFQNYSRSSSSVCVWNRRHPLTTLVTKASWAWCVKTFGESIDPLPFKEVLLRQKNRAAAWLAFFIARGGQGLWEGLVERDHEFLSSIWELLFRGHESNEEPIQLCIWREHSTSSHLVVLTPDRYIASSDEPTIRRHLPDPGERWQLSVAQE